MEENKKLLSMEGVLGRRNFIINYLIVSVIVNFIFNSPAILYLLINPAVLANLTSSGTTWWLLIGEVITAVLLFPSIVRRIRDIAPEQSENNIYLYSIIVALTILVSAVFFVGILFKWISFVLILILMCAVGTTSKRPADEVVRFNWGAFLGTWIWGLFNKAPITLLMIPLFFTTASFPFALICGLKGNEWAYENKTDKDIEKFHKSQRIQAVIWGVIIPIVYIVLTIGVFAILGLVAQNYAKTHPDFKYKLENTVKTYQELSIKTYFSDVKKVGDEYHFFMDPKIWSKMSDSNKMSVFNSAKEYVESQTKSNDSMKIMNNIKIYSSFNNELLGEYILNDETIYSSLNNQKGVKKITSLYKSIKEGYKFNNYPSLP